MCDHCKAKDNYIEHLQAHISGLSDAIYMATNEPWEFSEPIVIGGPQGLYTCISPFVAKSQWHVDLASAGASNAQIIVSSSSRVVVSSLDYTGNQPPITGYPSFEGIAIAIPANGCIPILSEWYDVIDSNNAIYVSVAMPANAAFVTLKFRQKRIVKQ